MNKEVMKQRLCAAIDARAAEIIALGEAIYHQPELGYKETRTAALVEAKFAELGFAYQAGIGITGVKAVLPGRGNQVTVGIMGELDSVLCPEHPAADPVTGAAHACGHNAMIAQMLGVGMALADTGLMAELDGRVALLAVPAEEPVEIEFRQRLIKRGELTFLGGKQELVKAGAFDDVDMAMIVHLSSVENLEGKKVAVGTTSNGFIAKFIRYIGKEAHAGGAPDKGVNALNAAMLGLAGIHAQRETFKDSDCIRIHPIITKGGDLVNIIPADVRLETYVRGKTMEAIVDASAKVNRALQAGAMAIGAEVVIDELPGFLPLFQDRGLTDLFKANAVAMVGGDAVRDTAKHGTGSTDAGDLAHLMPTIHPYCGGVTGAGHTKHWSIVDPELAYLVPAKILGMTVIDLLADGAAAALAIKAAYEPRYTKQEYLDLWENLCR